MFSAGLALADACVLGLGGARGQQGLAQALELRVLGMQVAQVGVDRVGGGDGQHQRLGIVDGRLLVEDAMDRQRVHASRRARAGHT